jgi:glycosyltransferase involved in cell wall biosynthesis
MAIQGPDSPIPAGTREPRVGLGMPVYNGARFVAAALDSILAQTLTDFELVICDNASTDETEAICRAYAARDSRIRYVRNPVNIGAHPNHNLCFELARGRYFKWTPHDDMLAPDYLAACVQALEENPDAVLCQSQFDYVDGDGAPLGISRDHLFVCSEQPSRRFAVPLLQPHNVYDVQGLFRRDAMARSVLLPSFHGADRTLVAQLALFGPFLHMPRPLLRVRDHDSRYTRALRAPGARAAFVDTRLKGRTFPTWRLYRSYIGLVRNTPLSPRERLRCCVVLGAWWFVNWNSARAMVDLIAVVFPGVVRLAERLKQSFSPAPGVDQLRKARRGT